MNFSLGDLVMEDFVAGGICHGGFSHRTVCQGRFCRKFLFWFILTNWAETELGSPTNNFLIYIHKYID